MAWSNIPWLLPGSRLEPPPRGEIPPAATRGGRQRLAAAAAHQKNPCEHCRLIKRLCCSACCSVCFSLPRSPSRSWWGLPCACWHPVPTDCSRSAGKRCPPSPAPRPTSSWWHSRSSSAPTTSPKLPSSWSPSQPKRTTTEALGAFYSGVFLKVGFQHLGVELCAFLRGKNFKGQELFFFFLTQYYFLHVF